MIHDAAKYTQDSRSQQQHLIWDIRAITKPRANITTDMSTHMWENLSMVTITIKEETTEATRGQKTGLLCSLRIPTTAIAQDRGIPQGEYAMTFTQWLSYLFYISPLVSLEHVCW